MKVFDAAHVVPVVASRRSHSLITHDDGNTTIDDERCIEINLVAISTDRRGHPRVSVGAFNFREYADKYICMYYIYIRDVESRLT